MLLDTTLLNLFVDNLGSLYTPIVYLTTLTTQMTLNVAIIGEFLDILSQWPTQINFMDSKYQITHITFWCNDYFKCLGWVSILTPYLHSFDYLHLFYLKQYFYKVVCTAAYSSNLSFSYIFSYQINTIALITFLMTKWGYAFTVLAVSYFFTNINQMRYQYGFNFYFNYFKVISDLGEQEYGSYDDFKFFLFFLVQLVIWYCWVLFLGYTFGLESSSFLLILTMTIMLTILLIPVKLLWDFGLAFAVYIRGAANSTNLLVEFVFDVLGVIIIFTRFIVQNIRFLLVFAAFFELFEWSAMNFSLQYMFDLSMLQSNLNEVLSQPSALFNLVINSIKIVSIYIYHLLHLIVISFMQIGVYLMVSFWLFFFLYTSFFKVILDSYFLSKRSI